MGALMRMLMQMLWERERLRGTAGWQPFEYMEATFAKLAFAIARDDLPTDVPLDYVSSHVRDDGLLRAASSANVVEVQGGRMRFYHQLIQDYLAGIALREQPNIKSFSIFDKWRYPVISWSAFVDNSDVIWSDKEIWDYPTLAGELILEGFHASDELHGKVIAGLINEIHIYLGYPDPDRMDPSAASNAVGVLVGLGEEVVPFVTGPLRKCSLMTRISRVEKRTPTYCGLSAAPRQPLHWKEPPLARTA